MKISFLPVKEDLEIAEVAAVADEIWHEYWPAIIGDEQTDYMVDNLQCASQMAADIEQHDYRYFLLEDEEGTCLGYTAAYIEDFTEHPDCEEAQAHGNAVNGFGPRRLFISKIYLYAAQRGKHYASRVIKFWESLARKEDCTAMYLTVNKQNELGIRAYKGRGFEVVEEFVAEIGDGYVMDDYIMLKPIAG